MNKEIKDKLENMYREQETIKNDWRYLKKQLKELKT